MTDTDYARIPDGSANKLRGLVVCLVVKSILDVLLVGVLAVGFYYVAFTPFIAGSLDEAGPEWVRGWAINQASPDSHVQVQLYINGRFTDDGSANFPYSGLVKKGVAADERHGFIFYTPPLDPGEYEARVYAVHESGGGLRRTLQLLGQPMRFTTDAAPAEPFFRGWFDIANQHVVKGWALDRNSPDARVEVHLYIDGRFVEARSADYPRPDLVAVGLTADERHGFLFYTPLLPPGEHEARAYAALKGTVEGRRGLRLIGRPIRFAIEP